MKYLFINSFSGFGSTGRLVAETCRELMAQGHECRIAFGRTEKGHTDLPEIQIGTNLDRMIHGLETRLLDNHGFSSHFATALFLQQVKQYDPDVIWLHNLHGYYIHVGMLFEYLRTCGKEIRWTLHDCWAFTGHCSHFTYVNCDRWKTGCHHCMQKEEYPETKLLDASKWNYERKKAAFTGIPNLKLIVPSFWLRDLVQQSFLKDYPVEVVYHSVDETVFHPVVSDWKERHGLAGKKMILSVSSIWDERKGLQDMHKLPEFLPDDCQVVMIGLTPEQISDLPTRILGLPRTDSVQELAEAYSAADVYVTASYEETFGMTILEAASCGTQAVVYAGTACEEIAGHFGGMAVPRGAENLAAGIRQVLAEGEGRQ